MTFMTLKKPIEFSTGLFSGNSQSNCWAAIILGCTNLMLVLKIICRMLCECARLVYTCVRRHVCTYVHCKLLWYVDSCVRWPYGSCVYFSQWPSLFVLVVWTRSQPTGSQLIKDSIHDAAWRCVVREYSVKVYPGDFISLWFHLQLITAYLMGF